MRTRLGWRRNIAGEIGRGIRISWGDRGSPAVSTRRTEAVNVFCMYALREGLAGITSVTQNLSVSEMPSIVTKFDKFLDRVRTVVARTEGQEVRHELVRYRRYVTTGDRRCFSEKPLTFPYQSEFAWHCFEELAARCSSTWAIYQISSSSPYHAN